MRAEPTKRAVMLALTLCDMEIRGLVRWALDADGNIRFSLTEAGRAKDPQGVVDGHTFSPEQLLDRVLGAMSDAELEQALERRD